MHQVVGEGDDLPGSSNTPSSHWVGATKQVATKSALTPLQWGLGIVGLFATPIALFGPNPMNYLAFGLFALCTILFAGLFGFAFIFRTHLVQSEEYRLEERRIELLGDDKHQSPKTIDAIPVPNPHEQIPLELPVDATEKGGSN